MRALPIGLMVLGLMGIAGLGICGGSEGVNQEMIAQEKLAQTIVSRAAFLNKVVIGVLDCEVIGSRPSNLHKIKKALIKTLRRNTQVKIINIRESCSFSDLKRNGYELAERYKMNYQLDMILHTHMDHKRNTFHFHYSLIDLYTKKLREVYGKTSRVDMGLWVKANAGEILVDEDLDRVLKAKKAGLPK
jgi:hypothetical protein